MEKLATRDSSSNMAESPKQYARSKRKRRHDDYARASSLYNYSETKTYDETKQGWLTNFWNYIKVREDALFSSGLI